MRGLADDGRANDLRTNGFRTSKAVGGTAITPLPALPRYVCIVALRDDGALCKPCWHTPNGWRVAEEYTHIIKAKFAPQHTAAHYEYHVIDGPQPSPTDLVCTLERDSNGHIIVIPGYRFKLVSPPDPADCGECT